MTDVERARKEKRPRKESSTEDGISEDNSSDCEVMVQTVRLSKEKICVKKGLQPKKARKPRKKDIPHTDTAMENVGQKIIERVKMERVITVHVLGFRFMECML